MSNLKGKIQNAIEFARSAGEVRRDDGAREIWIQTYPDLSEGKPGMAGAILSRAEAHAMRLAVIYALMDESYTIRREHLLAALALWEYAENSVKYIFGDRTGDPVADRIYDALGDSSEGLTRTEIRDIFGRNEKRERIDDSIALLVRYRKIIIVKETTGGRPMERVQRASTHTTKTTYTT